MRLIWGYIHAIWLTRRHAFWMVIIWYFPTWYLHVLSFECLAIVKLSIISFMDKISSNSLLLLCWFLVQVASSSPSSFLWSSSPNESFSLPKRVSSYALHWIKDSNKYCEANFYSSHCHGNNILFYPMKCLCIYRISNIQFFFGFNKLLVTCETRGSCDIRQLHLAYFIFLSKGYQW